MPLKLIIARDRRVPDRATGALYVSLKRPSGNFLQRCGKFDVAIRTFRERLKLIPPEEVEVAGGYMDAEIRKAKGGKKRIRLGYWKGTEPLGEFFQRVTAAWKDLPKELEDQGREIEAKE